MWAEIEQRILNKTHYPRPTRQWKRWRHGCFDVDIPRKMERRAKDKILSKKYRRIIDMRVKERDIHTYINELGIFVDCNVRNKEYDIECYSESCFKYVSSYINKRIDKIRKHVISCIPPKTRNKAKIEKMMIAKYPMPEDRDVKDAILRSFKQYVVVIRVGPLIFEISCDPVSLTYPCIYQTYNDDRDDFCDDDEREEEDEREEAERLEREDMERLERRERERRMMSDREEFGKKDSF